MKIKTGLIIFLMLLLAGSALAQEHSATGNPTDTPTGTFVTFEGASNTLDFVNSNDTAEVTVTTDDLVFIITTEAGFSLYAAPVLTENQGTTPGLPVTWEVGVTNEGNTDVTFTMTKANIIYIGSASNWSVDFIEGGTAKSSISTSLPDNGHIFFSFRIHPSSLETESPDASVGTVELTSDIGRALAGVPEYIGVNALTYAGFVSSVEVAGITIQAPIMTLTRVMTVDAPTLYTGDPHDPVPGAAITYTITYSNTGSGNATDAIIVDKVPDDTEGYHVNTTGSQTNVTITAGQGDATGWTVYGSSVEAPSFVYGETDDWFSIGALTNGTETFVLTNEATYIKWEKATVTTTEDDQSLTWGVTIQ